MLVCACVRLRARVCVFVLAGLYAGVLSGGIWLELGLGLDLSGLYIAGVVASRAQWRYGIFTASDGNQLKYSTMI